MRIQTRLVAAMTLFTVAAAGLLAVPHAVAGEEEGTPGTLQRFTYSSVRGTNPYLVYTPRSYHVRQPGAPASMVVMVHGCNTTALEQANASAFHALAERERFIVVYPDNTNEQHHVTGDESSRPARWVGSHPLQCWRFYDPTSNLRDSGDVAQVAGITREVMANWRIDPERVYAVGMSSGAMLTSALGATYPDLYAAIGVVAGCAYLATACPANSANSDIERPELQAQAAYAAMGEHARVVPTVVMHGDADTTVDPAAGNNAVRQWLMTNNLVLSGDTTGPLSLTPAATDEGHEDSGYTWSRDRYTLPGGCVISEHWRIRQMGHFWPGGSADPRWAEWTDWRAPSGAEATWAFFSRFRKSGTGQCSAGSSVAAGESPPRAEPTVCDLPAGDPDPQTQPDEWRERDDQNSKCANQRAEDQEANPAYQRALEAARMRMYREALADQAANPTRPRLTAPYLMPTNYYPGDPFRVAEDWAAAGRGSLRPVSFMSSSGAKIIGRLFYPKNPRGKLPAVVFITGSLQGFQEAYNAFYEGLAEEGYLVLSFDVQGQGRSETLPHNPDGTPGCGLGGCPGVPFQQDYNFFQGTRDALGFLFSSPARPYAASVPAATGPNAEGTDAYNPLWQLLDRDHVGIAGHSYGAWAVSLVGQEDERVKAIVGFDTMELVDESKARIHAPALNITSEDFFLANDPDNPPDPESNGTLFGGTEPREAYDQLQKHGVDAGLITLRSSGHNESSYGGSSMGSRYGERVAFYYTLAWFDRYLKGDRTGTRRLLARTIDGSADRSSIGAGTYDPATDRNVPYRIQGDCAANRVSIYFRSSLWLERGRHGVSDLRARGCP